jgi:hypothetical protein
MNDPTRYRFLKFGMRVASKVVREVGVNNFRVAWDNSTPTDQWFEDYKMRKRRQWSDATQTGLC